jgi:hypothetical protein
VPPRSTADVLRDLEEFSKFVATSDADDLHPEPTCFTGMVAVLIKAWGRPGVTFTEQESTTLKDVRVQSALRLVVEGADGMSQDTRSVVLLGLCKVCSLAADSPGGLQALELGWVRDAALGAWTRHVPTCHGVVDSSYGVLPSLWMATYGRAQEAERFAALGSAMSSTAFCERVPVPTKAARAQSHAAFWTMFRNVCKDQFLEPIVSPVSALGILPGCHSVLMCPTGMSWSPAYDVARRVVKAVTRFVGSGLATWSPVPPGHSLVDTVEAARETVAKCSQCVAGHVRHPESWRILVCLSSLSWSLYSLIPGPPCTGEYDGALIARLWPSQGTEAATEWLDAALLALVLPKVREGSAAVRIAESCLAVLELAPLGLVERLPARPGWSCAVISLLQWMTLGGVWPAGSPSPGHALKPATANAAVSILARLMAAREPGGVRPTFDLRPLLPCLQTRGGSMCCWMPGRNVPPCAVALAPDACCICLEACSGGGPSPDRRLAVLEFTCGHQLHACCVAALLASTTGPLSAVLCPMCRSDVCVQAVLQDDRRLAVRWNSHPSF